ncbi:MAG: PAS domain S-box protein [Solidesulfovibrio sp. DCME]|uniref:PAS domain-containing hybrid sensor histidine kinase/response regulator n=1 Tax=Solidesulfovibrio sp. DCME TaxID=3447380 RepID=UPI003D09F7A8
MTKPAVATTDAAAVPPPAPEAPPPATASLNKSLDAPGALAALLATPGIGPMLLDSLGQAIVLLAAATGIIVDANQAAAELFARPLASLPGLDHLLLHPREDRGTHRALMGCIRDGLFTGPCSTLRPMTVLRADGQRLSCRITAFPLRQDREMFLCGIFQSPSLQEILDRQLVDGEVHFATALPHLDEGIWSWAVDTDEVSLTDRWLEQLGYRRGDFSDLLENCRALLHPDDMPAVDAVLEARAKGEPTAFSMEFRLRHRDGSYRWMSCRGGAIRDASGKVVRLAGANADITARKEAEQALRESEQRYRLLAQNTPDAVFLHDMRGKVLDVNDRACTLLGYDRRTLLNLAVPDFEVVCPPDVLQGIWDAMQLGPFCFEGLARRADGSTFPTEVHGVAFVERGRTLCLVAARDLTLRKRYEQSLAEARDAAMAASLAKTEFLANMSHEIRTPMNIILGMTELLRETALTSAQKRYLAALDNSGRLLLHLLNDILDLSQIEANKLELRPRAFDPAALVAEVREFMRVPAEEKGLLLAMRHHGAVPATLVNDPDRLRQVLVNLIWNAVKFTPHGSITVTLAAAPPIGGHPALHVAVDDTGIGIAAADCQRVFAPFTQAQDPSGRRPAGTGLGLAICKRLVEGMGGEIGLQSRPGRGSRFHFTLPSLGEAPAATVSAPSSPAGQPAGDARRRRLLLVEDSRANQEMIRLFLENEPYDIEVAATGREALARFAPGRFDLILMDMEMPEMDGCAATEAIRRLEAACGSWRTPVVMLSAHAFAVFEQKGLAAGADAFLTKPIRRAVLLDTLRAYQAVAAPKA